jgi:drug/metabolite transporter (DMT)-like permease
MSLVTLSENRSSPLALMPGLFVLLWSTGFIGGKLGLPYAEPMTFLVLRFSLVTALMLVVSFATRASWPRRWSEAGHIAVVGLLLQGGYLGGVFIGIAAGVSAGLSALIVGIQPALTAALAGALLGEPVTLKQWLGLGLGLIGVFLVAASKIELGGTQLFGVAVTVLALFGITLGTLYQKRFCGGMDLRSGTVIQNAVAALLMLCGAAAFENFHVEWHGRFVFALTWLCLVLSVGATLLLFALLRYGAAARVASLFYLVPPVTALMAYLFFGETLGAMALFGMAVAVAGVALVNRR